MAGVPPASSWFVRCDRDANVRRFPCVQVCVIMEGSVTLSMETHGGMVKVVDLLPQEILSCGVIVHRAEPCMATANSRSKLLMVPDSAFKDLLHASVLF